MLLLSSGVPLDDDATALQRLQSACNFQVKAILGGCTKELDQEQSALNYTGLSCGSVFTLAAHLVNLARKLPTCGLDADNRTRVKIGVVMFTMQILSVLNDIRTLVDYCHTVVKLDNMDLLVCVTAIVNAHLDVILAIPRGPTLLRIILDQYCICRASSPPSRMVIEPLLDIFKGLNVHGRIIEYLEHELVLWDQTYAVMACSPLSDFQPDTATQGTSLMDELEYVIVQNPVLDEQSTNYLLTSLSSRLEEVDKLSILDQAALKVMFNRVRTPFVTRITRDWLHNQMTTNAKAMSDAVLLRLVQVGCLSTDIIDSAVSSAYEKLHAHDTDAAAHMASTILATMVCLSTSSSATASEKSGLSARLVQSVVRVLAVPDAATPEAAFCNLSFVSAFSKVLVEDPKALEEVLCVDSQLQTDIAMANIRTLALALLDPFKRMSTMRPSSLQNELDLDCDDATYMRIIDHALCTVDSTSLPVHTFALSCLTKVLTKREQGVKSLGAAMVQAVEKAMTNSNTCWLQLLPVFDGATLGEVSYNAVFNHSYAC
jgi:hypothetical protein